MVQEPEGFPGSFISGLLEEGEADKLDLDAKTSIAELETTGTGALRE